MVQSRVHPDGLTDRVQQGLLVEGLLQVARRPGLFNALAGRGIVTARDEDDRDGESFLKMGYREAGVRDLELAARISPESKPQIMQLLSSYGVR